MGDTKRVEEGSQEQTGLKNIVHIQEMVKEFFFKSTKIPQYSSKYNTNDNGHYQDFKYDKI